MADKRWITIISLIIVLFIAWRLIIKDKDTDKPLSKTSYIMGTIVKLDVFDTRDEEVIEGAFDVVENIEKVMSLNIEDSEINKVNKHAYSSPVKISDGTEFVIKKSLEYSKLSKGHFDISIGPVVSLWGIGTENARVPREEEISDALKKVGYENIVLKEDSVSLSKDNMILDLGGIAKGYAADKVAEYLKDKGIERAIIDLGGNIFALGSKEKGVDWNVGVQNPFNDSRGDFLGIVKVSDKSVVTSGVYERYLEADGKRYHHIIDPFTGYPVDNSLMSVTIVSDKSIDGDALSTAAFSLGLDKGVELIESLNGVDAIFVTKEKEVFVTNNLRDKFELRETEFELK